MSHEQHEKVIPPIPARQIFERPSTSRNGSFQRPPIASRNSSFQRPFTPSRASTFTRPAYSRTNTSSSYHGSTNVPQPPPPKRANTTGLPHPPTRTNTFTGKYQQHHRAEIPENGTLIQVSLMQVAGNAVFDQPLILVPLVLRMAFARRPETLEQITR